MTRHLFGAIPEIDDRIQSAPHVLLCSDFDGTLTPLVEYPEMAYLSLQTHEVLRRLAALERVSLAILSGRERAELQTRVNIPHLIYGGNHGLEISGNGFIFVEPTAAACSEPLRELATQLSCDLQHIPGAIVEDKGLTVSIHYRAVSVGHHEQVRSIVHAALAASDHPFRLSRGNKVHEIRPRVDWTKGDAVGWIREQLGIPDALVIYLGDDVTDEDAFAAFADQITVKVGLTGETAASFGLASPAQVERFLEWLADRLSQAAELDNSSIEIYQQTEVTR